MLEIKQDFLSKSHKLRPGTPIVPKSITIHNTGGAGTADQNRRWLDNPENNRSASWHYVLDEKEIIQAIPENEMAWHAGYDANISSIGVEICDWSNEEEREITWKRATKFAAQLLDKYGWGVEKLTTHNAWTGKTCPWLILPEWKKFVNDVQKELDLMNLTKIKVDVNGEVREFDGLLVEDKTYIGVRELLENLGYEIGWNSEERAVVVKKAWKE